MSAVGYLTVHTYASTARIPIPGVTITVTKRLENGGTDLIAVRITDESGIIEPIPIETPDSSESTGPGTRAPFTIVDLTADHPGYERILIENLQIFGGIETTQGLAMIPNSQFPETWNMTEVFQITPQNL